MLSVITNHKWLTIFFILLLNTQVIMSCISRATVTEDHRLYQTINGISLSLVGIVTDGILCTTNGLYHIKKINSQTSN